MKVSAMTSGAPALVADEMYVARTGGLARKLTLGESLALASRPQLVVNGDFHHARYGGTQALTTAAAYNSLDRWWAMQSTVAGATFGQVPSTLPGFRFAAKLQRTAGSILTNIIQCGTCFETLDAAGFQGKTVTLVAWLRKGANFSAAASDVSMCVDYGTGTDQSSVLQSSGSWTGHVQNNSAKVITAVDVRYTWSVAIPDTATQIGVRFFYTPTGTAGADDSVTIHGVRLYEGSAPPAHHFIRSASDLPDCLRWFWKSFPYGTAPAEGTGGQPGAIGYIVRLGAGNQYESATVSFPVLMRIVPAITFYNPSAVNAKWRNFNAVADSSFSAAAAFFTSDRGFMVQNQQVVGDLASHTLGIHAAARAEL